MRLTRAEHRMRLGGRVARMLPSHRVIASFAVLIGLVAVDHRMSYVGTAGAGETQSDLTIPFPAQGGPFMALEEPIPSEESRALPILFPTGVIRRLLTALPMGSPVGAYEISSPFGRRLDPVAKKPAIHAGIDLRVPRNAPVRARSAGIVVFAGWQSGYGRLVEVDHGMGVRSLYGHLVSIAVRRGQPVKEGQRIGRVGSSGRSTGPHLHYEIRINAIPRDPSPLLTLEGSRQALLGDAK